MRLIDAGAFRKKLVDRQITTQFFHPAERHEIGCIIDLLDSAPTIDPESLRPQWIPVTERLPDVNKTKSGYESITVIATDGKNVRPMKYERACVRTKSVRRWRWIWDGIYDGSPITHWMPLPAPPKEDV